MVVVVVVGTRRRRLTCIAGRNTYPAARWLTSGIVIVTGTITGLIGGGVAAVGLDSCGCCVAAYFLPFLFYSSIILSSVFGFHF